MADAALASRPAFGEALPRGRLGRLGGPPGVVAREVAWPGAAMLLARPGSSALGDALRPLGLDLPAPRRWTAAAPWQAFWLGPDRWLVTGPEHAARELAERVGGAADVIDQSDARAALTLRGPAVREALSRLFGIDLHPRAFGVGEAAATPAGHLGALLWQVDETPTFGVAVARSYAGNLADWLMESAGAFGMLVET